VALRYYLSLCGEPCLLVSWCLGDRCDITGSGEDLCRSRRLGVEDRGSQAHVGYQTIVRSGNAVYDLHRAHGDEEHVFLG
jgi:hypothetical protein